MEKRKSYEIMPMYTLWLRTSRKVNWNHAGSNPAMGAKQRTSSSKYVVEHTVEARGDGDSNSP